MKVEPVRMVGNVHENWRNFIKNFKLHMATNEYSPKHEEFKLHLLLDQIGKDAYKVYKGFEQSVKEESKDGELLDNVIQKFEEYFSSFKNIQNFNLMMFNLRFQKEGESFDDFLKDVEELAGFCNFGPVKKKYVKGKIMSGIADKNLQRKFFTLEDPTLEDVISLCKALEEAQARVTNIFKGDKNIFLENKKENNLEGPQPMLNIIKLINHDVQKAENPGPSSAQKVENAKNGKKEDDEVSNESCMVVEVVKSPKKIKPKRFSCFKCDKGYVYEGNLTNHLATNHNRKSYKGAKYSLVYDSSKQYKNLKMKIKKEHEAEIFTCDDCGKKFQFKDTLADHVNSHLAEKPFSCNQCQKKFSTKKEFIKHLDRKH